MPQGDIYAALREAQRMAWDETIGYTFGGDGNPDSAGYDCSAFVIRCLYRAGFNVPATRVGTGVMGPQVLIPAGFQEIQYVEGMQMEDGDIMVMNTSGAGHTYFYAKNVYGYLDIANWDQITNTKGICQEAKIEASSSRGTAPGSGDNDNGLGAHTEVWVHRTDSSHLHNGYTAAECKVYRWPNALDTLYATIALLIGTVIGGTAKSHYKRRKNK